MKNTVKSSKNKCSKEQPLVSVLMAVYNEERWVARAIESVLKQDYENLEFIIVDDGSTDNTQEILQQSRQQNQRIKVIRQQNQGLSTALNNGLDHCSGRYVARIDADEKSTKNRIRLQAQFLEQNPTYALVGGWSRIEEGNRTYVMKLPVEDMHIKKELVKNCVLIHSTVMVRTDLMKRYKYTPMYSQDWHLWVKLAMQHRVHNLPRVLTRSSKRPYSSTATRNKFKTMRDLTKISFMAYRTLPVPRWYIVYVAKPFVGYILPNRLIEMYVKWKMSNNPMHNRNIKHPHTKGIKKVKGTINGKGKS